MNIIENITCECGAVFEWNSAGKYDFEKPLRCRDCYERLKVEREAREAARAAEHALELEQWIARNREKIISNLEQETPALFRKTDITHPEFNATAWAKIKDHRLSEDYPWMGMVGMTGRCKSRMAFLYASELLRSMTDAHLPQFAFVSSYEIGEAVARQYGSNFQEKDKARQYLDRLREVDVLLIDDIGKGRLTPAVASELFALIDHRHSHLDTTIWTSNSSPESIAAGLPEDMAGPFAGRIIESSTIFTLK